MTERTKLVVVDEHTLGYIDPEQPDYAGVLHASILKGATFCVPASIEPILIKHKKVRLASAKDFNDFRVSFKGFDNEQLYEFKK